MLQINLVGQRFGRLVVIEQVGRNKWGSTTWLCRCDCGTHTVVSSGTLRCGNAKSCGGHKSEDMTRRNTTHGQRHSRAYVAWCNMRRRCTDSRAHRFDRYGGRGITYCERWQSFQNFLDDMGQPPTGHSLDRIDVDGNYCPENCRWADAVTQSRNRSNIRRVTQEVRPAKTA